MATKKAAAPSSTRPTRSKRSSPRPRRRKAEKPAKAAKADKIAKAETVAKAPRTAKAAPKVDAVKKSAKAKTATKSKATETVAPVRARNDNALVIVESPAKAKTIKKYLGARLRREGVGRPRQGSAAQEDGHRHRARLPARVRRHRGEEEGPGGDQGGGRARPVACCWRPTPIAKGRRSPGTSPRRSGKSNPNIQRVLFNEITKKAVIEAIGKPMALDVKKFESQQARRILDRLVGYEISPVLWTKVRRGLSAGRVQSVAVRLVVEREAGDQRVQAAGVLDGRGDRRGADAAAVQRQGDEARRQEAGDDPRGPGARGRRRHAARRRCGSPRSSARSGARTRRRPSSPRSCSRRRRASCASRPSGRWACPSASTRASRWATRARSASSRTCVPTRRASRTTRSPRRARTSASKYGPTFLPAEPVVYKTKKGAQDAHEAIRPTVAQVRPGDGARAVGGRQGRRPRRARVGRPAAALHADLEPLRRVPDGAGGVRSDDDRHLGGARRGCARPVR